MRNPSFVRGVLLAAMPLMVLLSVALAALKTGREPERYDFKLLYLILHDDHHGTLPPAGVFERRLAHLETVMERESFGRIRVESRLHFLPVREIGDDRLAYATRTVYEWIPVLDEYCRQNGIPYDILVFCPASGAYGPWCTDGPSQGYSYHDRKYLCLETFLDQAKEEEDDQAVALAMHKIFHGFGYNHISQENRPANLLEWNLGLPKTRILPLAPREPARQIIFDKHIMKVLGFLPRNDFEKECPDRDGLTCLGRDLYFCENAYDIRCVDSDQDGVVDGEDDYLFTPYASSNEPDTDSDGIPDPLDLCAGNEIAIYTNIPLRKMKALVDRDSVEMRIEPASRIKGVNLYDAKNIGGFIGFLKGSVKRVTGNRLSLDPESLSAITRLQIFYDTPEGSFYRPFYLYRKPQRIEYVNEKEWYYFSRFGCDIPLGVRFDDPSTYDGDLDGIPDRELFPFADRIRDDYDWDSDGIPDIEDSLPTVHGSCSTRFVKGVPDSDGDGLCDPANFRFAESVPGMMEGDLAISFMEDVDADHCPYVHGTKTDGCP